MGRRGMVIRNFTKNVILDFLKDKEYVGFEQIAKHCQSLGIYRNTVKKYLDELKEEGLVEQNIEGRHPYRITQKGIEFRFIEKTKQKIESIPKEQILKIADTIKTLLEIIDVVTLKDFLNAYKEKLAEMFGQLLNQNEKEAVDNIILIPREEILYLIMDWKYSQPFRELALNEAQKILTKEYFKETEEFNKDIENFMQSLEREYEIRFGITPLDDYKEHKKRTKTIAFFDPQLQKQPEARMHYPLGNVWSEKALEAIIRATIVYQIFNPEKESFTVEELAYPVEKTLASMIEIRNKIKFLGY